jgi:endonuclease YncB( thermonuclease family)
MPNIIGIFLFTCMLNIFSIQVNTSICAERQIAHVVHIHDGDTIRVEEKNGTITKIRLYGIDCPEADQSYGSEATQRVKDFTDGQPVEIEAFYQDRYRRSVALVLLADGMTLQERLLIAGLAWVDQRYCDRPECVAWKEEEQVARSAGVGVWAAPEPLPPWEWRRLKRRGNSSH